jgi:hypothetical protein
MPSTTRGRRCQRLLKTNHSLGVKTTLIGPITPGREGYVNVLNVGHTVSMCYYLTRMFIAEPLLL